jgi:hypothetical protein
MEKTNEEAAFLLEGFAGGDTLAGELLKQVGDLGHSIWKSVAAEAGNHMALANALDRFANTIERVTDSVLSDGQPVNAEKIEAARMQASDLRVAAEKMRSAAASIGAHPVPLAVGRER